MKKIKYIYIVGVEGCGHHGLHPMLLASLREYLRREMGGNDAVPILSHWQPMREVFNHLWHSPSLLAEQRNEALGKLHTLLSRVRQRAESTNAIHYILEDKSFPSGRYRSLAHQWKLPEMHSIMSAYADVYYVVLYRDPIAMTFSHPEFDGGLRNHAAVLAAYLEQVNAELQNPAIDHFLTVHYEDIMAKDQDTLSRLASYLDIPEQFFQYGVAELRPGKKDWRTQLANEDKQWLMEFFNEERLAKWPAFEPLRSTNR